MLPYILHPSPGSGKDDGFEAQVLNMAECPVQAHLSRSGLNEFE